MRETLDQLISDALSQVSGIADCQAILVPASRPEFGDYQANGVMSIAKQLKKNPRELAAAVCDRLESGELVDHFEVAGPGFINIHLSDNWLASRATALLDNQAELVQQTARPETIVVDYSSPNLAKEMHVGHLRGTIIGDSLVRILERLGHQVIRQNHVGDWGTQFGMLLAYLQQVSDDLDSLSTELEDLEAFYRAAKEKFDADPEFANQARNSVVRLQGGDEQSLMLWHRFIEESLRHCEAVYDKLQIRMRRSDLRAESFYNDSLPGIISELEKQDLLTVSQGASCVFLPEFQGKENEPLPLIVQKSDGGYLYATTDLAAIRFRATELAAERVLYVVDARQGLHFQQVFAVARAAGFVAPECRLEHVAYGTMMGKDGKPFKTRSGGLIKLIDLLDEAVRRAFDLVSARSPELDEETRREIADKVGIGAVKYADLSKNRTSDYVFDWDSMLALDGNTAPYLLYAYTRIRSILRRQEDGAEASITATSAIAITTAEERQLIVKLLRLPEILQTVATDYYPSHLCTYLFELAGLFMRFYEACPILKAEPPVRASRLALARFTAATLSEGLDLLGLETLEQM
ncbi:MAG: arginine--tRNA ligase [Pseudomonadales bacterium]|nr:arginine--tRNA ligase [Pseudomonadales bacterium]